MASTYPFTGISGATLTTCTIQGATLDGTVSASGLTAISNPNGGLINNWDITAASGQGNNTAMTSTTMLVTAIWIPSNMTITNISFQVGTTGGTNTAILALFNSAGTPVANTALAGTTVGTANTTQTIALTATYAAKGPALFFVGLYYNGATATAQTVPANVGAGLFAGSIGSQTFGTVAAITPPSTFTANTGPIVWLS